MSSSTAATPAAVSSKIDKTVIRATDVLIQGDVTVGACCVLSPQCRIFADPGAKIIIGSHNLIEDQVVIRCSAGKTLTIGSHNMICVGTQIQDSQVGSYNTIRAKCRIGKGVTIQDDSLIADMTVLDAAANVRCRTVPTRTCVFRNNDGLRVSMHANAETRPEFEAKLRRMLELVSKLMLEVSKKKAAAAAAAKKQAAAKK
eukprot:INCI849.1.p1 GENE.INCI849.1~~INCI849.1.p1  ORF type:complete len:201 (+),score=46.90 INCI849.1:69-671(+)